MSPMHEQIKAYHRALLLHVMQRAGKPITAGDLVELMGAFAMAEQHPEPFWRRMDASLVLGLLRKLTGTGEVKQGAEKQRNPRHARDEPTWVLSVPEDFFPAPHPEFFSAETARALARPPAAAASPYDGLTRSQLYTLLRFNDDHACAIARFMRDVADINERFRRALSEQGMELPE